MSNQYTSGKNGLIGTNWIWFPEKFRHINLPMEPIDTTNPVPLLMQADSAESMKEIGTAFNQAYNSDLEILSSGPVCDAAIDFHGLDRSVDWSNHTLIGIYLPTGQGGEFISASKGSGQ